MKTSVLPGVRGHLAGFIEEGQCLGGQLFVWHDGELLADEGVGCSSPGRDATADAVGQLQCAVKPLIACCLARAAERGEMSLDDPVQRWLPGFRGGRRDGVTVRMLLSHTSGLPNIAEPDCYSMDFGGFVDMICRRPLPPILWYDGAVYSMVWAWHLLGAVLERVHDAGIDTILAEEISATIQRDTLRLVGPADRFSWYWRRQGPGQFAPILPVDSDTFFRRPNPAYGGIGSMADLGHFFVDLLCCLGGQGRLLQAESLRALTARHSMVTFGPGGAARPYGLGFFLGGSAGDLAGPWSPGCFGHVGSIWRHYNVCAFADPATRTVAAVRLFSLSARNNRWFRRFGQVLSADLRLAPASS